MSLAMQTLIRASREALSREGVRHLLADGGQLVDVRLPADFGRGSLSGAINIPVESLSYECHLLSRKQPVIVCGASEFRSSRAARLLAGKGFQRIYHFGHG